MGDDEFVTKLQSTGAQVTEINIYKTVIPEQSKKLSTEIFKEGIDIATFTSSSTVHGLVDLLGGINKLKNVIPKENISDNSGLNSPDPYPFYI